MRGWSATIAGLAVALAVATPASAGEPGPTESLGTAKGIEYLRAKFEAVVSQAGAPANCDVGDFVTGGGGSINGDPTTATLNSTFPFDTPGPGWQAEGTSSSGARTVTSFAICGPDGTSLSTAGETFDPGTEFNSGIACPGEVQALSGGIEANGANMHINGTFPNIGAYDWTNSVETVGVTQVFHRLSCSDSYTRKYREAAVRVKPGEAGRSIRECKPGEVVIGGGIQSLIGINWQHDNWTLASKPWDSKDANKTPEDGWLVKLYNDGASGIDLNAIAACYTA
jgi:hypothetical protein